MPTPQEQAAEGPADGGHGAAEPAAELASARTDAGAGQVPGSVMQALNHDAAVADSACGTI